MADPPVEKRLERLNKAKLSMKSLVEAPEPYKFKQECEEMFSEFRLSCVHLRRERAALDSVSDKEVAWHFICRFSKECPFQHARCCEVLKILLLSDDWMKAFLRDPDVDVSMLPPDIAQEFQGRLEEVKNSNPESPGAPPKTDPWSQDKGYPKAKPQAKPAVENRTARDPWSQAKRPDQDRPSPAAPTGSEICVGMPQLTAKSMTMVVQRCLSASLSATQKIGPGLVISVCMADGATEEGVRSAAKFVLTAKLSGRSDWFPAERGLQHFGGGAESVVALCKAGIPQGILVVHQPSLVADIQDGETVSRDLAYARTTKTSLMYDLFVESLYSDAPRLVQEAGAKDSRPGMSPALPEVIGGQFGSNVYIELKSAGPFTHSFSF